MPQIDPSPAQFDMDALLKAEAAGELDDDAVAQMQRWRQRGVIPQRVQMPAGTQPNISDEAFGEAYLNANKMRVQAAPQMKVPEPPKPKLSWGQQMSILPAEMMDTAKSAGRFVKDNLLTPQAVGATAGGLLGGIPGAAIGGAAGELGQQMYETWKNPEQKFSPVERGVRLATAAGTSAMAEGTGKLIPARPKVSPRGQAAAEVFGKENMGAHQLVDNPMYNFIANVAESGPSGTRIMKKFNQRQAEALRGRHMDMAENIKPGALNLDPETGALLKGPAAQKQQMGIAGQIKELRSGEGSAGQQIGEFLKNFGGAREVDDARQAFGDSVASLWQRRSEILDAARDANLRGDANANRQLLGQADNIAARIESIVPPGASDAWRQASREYAVGMNRLDSPPVYNWRMTNSEKAFEQPLTGGLSDLPALGQKTGLTAAQKVNRLKAAIGKEGWEEYKANAVYDVAEKATNKDGVLDASQLAKHFEAMDTPTKHAIFGADVAEGLNKTIEAVHTLTNYQNSQAGRLFIAIRTGGAMIQGASSGAAAVGAIGAGEHFDRPMAGMAGAAAILISPAVFAKMLTTKAGQRLLINAAGASTKTPAGRRAIEAITKYTAQLGATEAADTAGEIAKPKQSDESFDESDFSIPTPPNRVP